VTRTTVDAREPAGDVVARAAARAPEALDFPAACASVTSHTALMIIAVADRA